MASPRSITSRGSGASDPDLSPEGSDPVFVSTAQEKIRLTKAEETCLASLFCRVQDANSTQPILGDVYAQATFSRCEFDQGRTTVSGVQQSGTVLYASHRALRLDTWCEEFLLSREDPVTVLYLGCGLDCRYLRIRDRLRGREKQPEFRVSKKRESLDDCVTSGSIPGPSVLTALKVDRHRYAHGRGPSPACLRSATG